MAKRKNMEELIQEDVSAEFLDFEEETTENTEEEPKEKTSIFIKLVKGGSFTSGLYSFKKGVPTPVDIGEAEKFMQTGFFERV